METESPNSSCNSELNSAFISMQIASGMFYISEKTGRSKVWQIFGMVLKPNGEEIKGFVACRSCKKVLKYCSKSTSNLVKHKCYNLMRIDTVETTEIDEDMKKNVTKVVTKWLISNCRPYHLVKDKGFVEVLQQFVIIGAKYGIGVNVEHALPHPSTVSRNVSKIYDKCFAQISAEINFVKGIGFGLTTDLWTDNFLKKSYLAVTIHYLLNGNLKNRLLGLKSMQSEKCTGANVYSKMTTLLDEFDCCINNKLVVVTDRGSNMKRAFDTSHHLFCINHLLNNVVQNATKECVESAETVSGCIKLVKYFKKSGLNATLASTLKSYCSTRWNTLFYLLESIQKNWSEIYQVLQAKNELHRTTSININNVRDLIDTLKPFEEASKSLEGDKYPTLHLVIVYIHKLKKGCIHNGLDSTLIVELKAKLLYNITTVVEPNMNIFHKIAVFLFPPTNKLLQFSELEKKLIEAECAKHMLLSENENQITPEQAESNSYRPDLFMDFIDSESVYTPQDNVTKELQMYKNTKVNLTENFNVLNWWQLQKTNLLMLYNLSCLILAIPASSAPSERVFSSSRNMLSEKRSTLGLNDVAVNQLMFIHLNLENEDIINTLELSA